MQVFKIPEYKNYYVDKNGNVYHIKKLKPQIKRQKNRQNSKGYHSVGLYIRSKNKYLWRLIHHLILETFVGLRKPNQQTRHLNGNPHDNRLKNLKWGTSKENIQDTFDHGNWLVGEKSSQAKLSEKEIIQMRKLRKKGLFYYKIAKKFNISRSQAFRIINNQSWKHVT